jgi:hypothetical protein
MHCSVSSVNYNRSLNDILNDHDNYTVADFCNNLDDDNQIETARCIRELALVRDGFFKITN